MIKLTVGLSSALLAASSVVTSASATEVQVVVAHYKESIAWIQDARAKEPNVKYTIYSKNSNPPEGSLRLQNVGRESHTFLHHIVANYDNLADWTVFTQASTPGFGFRPNDHESGHMSSGVTWEDYLKPKSEGWYEVQTVATRYPEMWHSDRFDMMFEIPTAGGNVCPDMDLGWSNWWTENEHPLLKKQTTDGEFLPPIEFYNRLVVAGASDKYYQHFTLNYANGGRFAVSRDRIHSRPASYYKDLLHVLSKNVNPIEGYYMETMWYDAFHPENLQAEYGPVCSDVPPFSEEGATNHATMYSDAMSQYRRTLIDIYGSKALIPRNLMISSPYFVDDDASDYDYDLLEVEEGPAVWEVFPSTWSPQLSGTGNCSVLANSVTLSGRDKDKKPTGIYGNVCVFSNDGKIELQRNQIISGFAKLESTVETKVHDKDSSFTDYVWNGTVNSNLVNELAAARTASTSFSSLECDTTMEELPTLINLASLKNATKEGPVVICIEKDIKIDDAVIIAGGFNDSVVFNVAKKFEVNKGKVTVAEPIKPSDVIWHFTGDKEDVKIVGDNKQSGYPSCCSTKIDGSILSLSRKVTISASLINGQVISEAGVQINEGSLIYCHSEAPYYEWPPLSSDAPSATPSLSVEPTSEPSAEPSAEPTKSPMPSKAPTVSSSPTAIPSDAPSEAPSSQPSEFPSQEPSEYVPLHNTFKTILQFDNKPNETGFFISCNDERQSSLQLPPGTFAPASQDNLGMAIADANLGNFNTDEKKLTLETSLLEGTVCNVTLTDLGGDGICCDNGNGYYKFYQGSELEKEGNKYDSELKFQVTIKRPSGGA